MKLLPLLLTLLLTGCQQRLVTGPSMEDWLKSLGVQIKDEQQESEFPKLTEP